MQKSIFALLAVCTAVLLELAVAGRSEPPLLLIHVDAYDNLTEAKRYWGAEVYGPEQVAEFFANCRRHGVGAVYWRTQTQIAAHRSRLNYHLGQVREIPSNADDRRRSGAFAARVGVRTEGGGLFQRVEARPGEELAFSAWISTDGGRGARTIILDDASGDVLGRGEAVHGEAFQRSVLRVTARGPVRAGVAADGADGELTVFIADDLSLQDKSGRERLLNGGMEDFHMLQPTAWSLENGLFLVLNGDVRAMDPEERQRLLPHAEQFIRWTHRAEGEERRLRALESYDPLEEAVRQAAKHDIRLYAWMDPIDDGRLVLPPARSWSSRFLEEHPQYRLVDREGRARWGQLCFGYSEVRAYKTALVEELLDYGVDGVALKMSYQHHQVWDGNSYDYEAFAYNDVALEEYHHRWGEPENGLYRREGLREVHGDFFVQWLRELRPLFRERGRELSLFIGPGNYLDTISGRWRIDWQQIVREGLIDELQVEPRHGGPYDLLFDRLDAVAGYSALCRAHGVRLGGDFYLNALAERRMQPASINEEPKAFFRNALLDMAAGPLDLIGIYEGMYVDAHDYWPEIGAVRDALPDVARRPPYERPADGFTGRRNVALATLGTTATWIGREGERDADALLNGDLLDSSSLAGSGLPITVELRFPHPVRIDATRLFPGYTGYVGNPSGECGPLDYTLESFLDDEWIELLQVEDAPRLREQPEESYFFSHDLHFDAVTTERLRLVITRSGDTGCRIHSPRTPIVPENDRVIYLREIEVFAAPE